MAGPPVQDDCPGAESNGGGAEGTAPSRNGWYIPPVPSRPPQANGKKHVAYLAVLLVVIHVGYICYHDHVSLLPPGTGPGSYFDPSRAAHVRSVSATLRQADPYTIAVTYDGGPDASQVRGMTVTVLNNADVNQKKSVGQAGGDIPLDVGSRLVFTGDFQGYSTITVVAEFADGTEQALLYADCENPATPQGLHQTGFPTETPSPATCTVHTRT